MDTGKEWWVGCLFFVALVTLIFVTIYLSDISLGGDSRRHVVFDSVKGLREGDDVNVAGMRVGTVRDIRFLSDEGRVRVTLGFKQPVTILEGYSIEINESTLLGGNAVNIFPGPSGGTPIPDDSDLVGQPPVEMIRSLGRVVSSAEDKFGNILEDVLQITDGLTRGKGSIGVLLEDDTLVRSLTSTSEKLERIATRLDEGEGTIGRLLLDSELFDNISSSFSNFADLSEQIRTGSGSLSLLIRERDLHDNLNEAVANLKEITGGVADGSGTVGKFFKDETLYDDVKDFVATLGTVAGDLKEGSGALGLLLRDEETRQKLQRIFDDVGDIASRVNNGDGSLAKLLATSELHDELMKTLATVNNAVEDARESAPLSTFTAALFTAF